MGSCTFCHLGSTGMCSDSIEKRCKQMRYKRTALANQREHPQVLVCMNCEDYHSGECSWSRGEPCRFIDVVLAINNNKSMMRVAVRANMFLTVMHMLKEIPAVPFQYRTRNNVTHTLSVKSPSVLRLDNGTFDLRQEPQKYSFEKLFTEHLEEMDGINVMPGYPRIRWGDKGIMFGVDSYEWVPLNDIPKGEEAFFLFGTIDPGNPIKVVQTLRLGDGIESESELRVDYLSFEDHVHFDKRMLFAEQLVLIEENPTDAMLYSYVHFTIQEKYVKRNLPKGARA